MKCTDFNTSLQVKKGIDVEQGQCFVHCLYVLADERQHTEWRTDDSKTMVKAKQLREKFQEEKNLAFSAIFSLKICFEELGQSQSSISPI